ncbi:hypothetical protein [Rhizobium leguminosarum]|uniref:hypothetical protein n=1 Tax=Rhizobium leguminosarum TaxID=384 RepID=UPI001C9558C2|nr:hypothetical protein [Rhizobium leguminosarum]MBY5585326.1 hypothetical protein [Rhizobium leguminosarum]
MFDKQTIDIPCPKCGHETTKTIAWIKAHNDFVCAKCGSMITIDKEEILAGLKKAKASLAKFGKSIGKMGKRR